MSYSREDGPPKYIVFYYDKSAIFENISLRTMYRAKTIINESKESMIDEYAMSPDEMDAFELFIRQAVYDVFDIVLKMTTGISDNPIFIDKTIVVNPGVDYPNSYGFKIIDEDGFNENNLYTVDDGVKKYIDAHIMASWYSLVGHDTEYTKWLAVRDDARSSLITKKLFQLRKAKIS